MTDFRTVQGFEEVWRPPVGVRPHLARGVLRPGRSGADDVRARLARVANRAPEVMVKVTGRTRDPAHLRAHLDYISRNGELELETQDGALLASRAGISELAAEWASEQLADRRTRADAPFCHSVIVSMPAGTDELALRDAARAFAADMFAGRHEYVFTLHTDTPRPHVHLSICSRGYTGERLNPKKVDLELWRQTFAQALRDRGVEAEATPRRARGVSRKAERTPIRKMRDRHEGGDGSMPRVRQLAYREAAGAAFQNDDRRRPWEQRLLERQEQVRRLYLAQARLLAQSPEATDRALAARVVAFLGSMPQPDTQRLAMARELRAAARSHAPPRPGGKDRTR